METPTTDQTEASATPRDVAEDPFEQAAGETIGRVQDAFTELVAAVPGLTGRPSEIQRALGLHKTLAWKLAKIVDASDRLTVYRRLPGDGAIAKILDAAARVGVERSRLDAVRTSVRDLERFVERHAGHRETLEIMLAGSSRGRLNDAELSYRKDGFRATSHIWGVQARTVTRSVITWPSADDKDMLDAAIIFGVVDFLRLRPDRPWVVNRWRPTDDDGAPIAIQPTPIDSESAGGSPLLRDFCSDPNLDVRRAKAPDCTLEDEVAAGQVGTRGAVTLHSAEVLRNVMPRFSVDGSRMYAQNLELRTPCRTVVFDHLVHRDLYGRVAPRFKVFGELAGRPLYVTLRSGMDRLEVFERVEYLGNGSAVLRTPDVPRYDQMIQHVCHRLGWDPDMLDAYRVRMEYPYVPITMTYDYPLPEPPR